jgi:hypothetical protein
MESLLAPPAVKPNTFNLMLINETHNKTKHHSIIALKHHIFWHMALHLWQQFYESNYLSGLFSHLLV